MFSRFRCYFIDFIVRNSLKLVGINLNCELAYSLSNASFKNLSAKNILVDVIKPAPGARFSKGRRPVTCWIVTQFLANKPVNFASLSEFL